MAYTPQELRYLDAVKTQEFGPVLGDLQAPNWQAQYPNFAWSWPTGKTNPRVVDKTTGQLLQTGAQPSSYSLWNDVALPGIATVGAAAGIGAGIGAMGGATAGGGVAGAGTGATAAELGAGGAGVGYGGAEAGATLAGQGSGVAYGGAAGTAAEGAGSAAGAGAGTTTGTAGTAAGTAAAGGSAAAVSRILQGNGTTEDYISVLGAAAPALLGAYASNQQTGALKDLSQQYLGFGAPSRARYEASYAPGFTMANEPGYTDAINQASKATLHGLSTQGNPAGSPNAWAQSLQDLYSKTAYPALQTYRNQAANTGGIGTLTSAAPGAATGAITSQGNVYNAIGAGINDIFNPRTTLTDLLKALPRYA